MKLIIGRTADLHFHNTLKYDLGSWREFKGGHVAIGLRRRLSCTGWETALPLLNSCRRRTSRTFRFGEVKMPKVLFLCSLGSKELKVMTSKQNRISFKFPFVFKCLSHKIWPRYVGRCGVYKEVALLNVPGSFLWFLQYS